MDVLPAVLVLFDYPADRFSAETVQLNFIERRLDRNDAVWRCVNYFVRRTNGNWSGRGSRGAYRRSNRLRSSLGWRRDRRWGLGNKVTPHEEDCRGDQESVYKSFLLHLN